MLTIMTTKNFLNAIDDAYAKGVCAGTMQQKLTDHEDQIGEIDLPVVDGIGEALEAE